MKNIPERWRDQVFSRQDDQYCLKIEYKDDVQFILHDVRDEFHDDLVGKYFDLVLCRNFVFTYLDEPLQYKTFERILSVLMNDGVLVLGVQEKLPDNVVGVRT